MTDVNKDKAHSNVPIKPVQENIKFALPSYASGILSSDIKLPQSDLLPPLSSGNYNYPSLNAGQPLQISSTQQDNSYQNEISSQYQPTQGITHNIDSHTTKHDYTTIRPVKPLQNTYPSPPDSSIQLPNNAPKTSTVGNIYNANSYSINPPTQIQNTANSVSSSPNQQNTNAVLFQNNQQNDGKYDSGLHSPMSVKPSNDGKYTGGFGGAPGLLGEQKIPGYAVPSGSVAGHVAAPSASPHYQQHQNNLNAKPSVPSAVSNVSVQSQHHETTSQAISGVHKIYTVGSTAGTKSNPNNNGKYTGGFGGPPGFLSPYDNKPHPSTSTTSSYSG